MFSKWWRAFPYTSLGYVFIDRSFDRKPAFRVEFLYMVHGLGGMLKARPEVELEQRVSKLESILKEGGNGSK